MKLLKYNTGPNLIILIHNALYQVVTSIYFSRERRGKKGRSWYRGVGVDRDQSRHKTIGEDKAERHIFGPKSRTLQKRPRKSAVQAGVPERDREKRDARNAW